MSRKNNFKSSAFSLIEISVVILIIGILIGGTLSAKGFYRKSIISSAVTLTKSSPVAAIKNLNVWLETSSEESLKDSESNIGSSITTWNDISFQSNKSPLTVGSVNPTADSINNIPTIKFPGDSNSGFSLDGKFLNGSDYTIMIVEQRSSGQSDNYFIGDSTISASNQNLLLGYSANGTVIHSQAGTTASANSNSYSATVNNYSSASPNIFVFTNSATSGKNIYLNGSLIASSSNTDTITNLSTLQIGKGYDGQIAEIAIYTRSLKDDEIADIVKYAGKKWTIKTATSVSSNCPISTEGISATSVVSGSSTKDCDIDGYSGSVSYNCSNGTATPSGSCSEITCTTTSGIGYNAKSNLPYAPSGTGSFNCDITGYTGTKSYTCITSGAAVITGGTCSNGGGSYFGTSGSGNYLAQLSPFGSATFTSDATFQAWFANNNCVNSPSGVGSSPGSYTFANGTISNSPSGYIIWMTSSTSKYWKTSSWQSMFVSSAAFGANISAIGCAQ
jgi:prepilin-type N-terminal cleavage/methylation domain-containing protein